MPYPTTPWTTTPNPPLDAPGCELKIAVGGGQRWIIVTTGDWICRITVPIRLMGEGTGYTQTP